MPIHFFLQKFQTNHFYTCLVLFHKAFCIYERPMCANHKIAWLALALAISGSCSALEHCCSTPPLFTLSLSPLPPFLPGCRFFLPSPPPIPLLFFSFLPPPLPRAALLPPTTHRGWRQQRPCSRCRTDTFSGSGSPCRECPSS